MKNVGHSDLLNRWDASNQVRIVKGDMIHPGSVAAVVDMENAVCAVKRSCSFGNVICCHDMTFGELEHSAQVLNSALPDVNVIAAQFMVPNVF